MSKASKIQEKITLLSALSAMRPYFHNLDEKSSSPYTSNLHQLLQTVYKMRADYLIHINYSDSSITKYTLTELNTLFSQYVNALSNIVSQFDYTYVISNIDVTNAHTDINNSSDNLPFKNKPKDRYMYILYRLLIEWDIPGNRMLGYSIDPKPLTDEVVRYLQNRNSSDSINNNTSNENNTDDIEYVKSKLLNGLFGNNNNNNPITPSKIINNNIWINPPYTSEKIQTVLNTVKNKTSN